MEEEDLCAINRNKRKFQDEVLEVHVAKQACLCLESAKDSNSFSSDSVMSDKTSSSSSVHWSGTKTTCDDISASSLYQDCEFSSSEHESMEDLLCSNAVISNNSVLSSGRWNLNQDAEQGTEKLTIDKEFEQYFSMLML